VLCRAFNLEADRAAGVASGEERAELEASSRFGISVLVAGIARTPPICSNTLGGRTLPRVPLLRAKNRNVTLASQRTLRLEQHVADLVARQPELLPTKDLVLRRERGL